MHTIANDELRAEPHEVVLRFLESVGRRSDAEFYLALFRATAKERFACIVLDKPVVGAVIDAVALDLRFLGLLGLAPVLAVGLLDASDAQAQAQATVGALQRVGVASCIVDAGPNVVDDVAQACRSGNLPVVILEPTQGDAGLRFATLEALVLGLQSRKLIFLQRRGGLRSEGRVIPLVNLTQDFANLQASAELSRKQRFLLNHIEPLVCRHATHKLAVAIASPLELLRELFTVKGAGTFLRPGARVMRHEGWQDVDMERLTGLLESAFGRALAPLFFQVAPWRVYIEQDYRGAAVLLQTPIGAYLSKFAVEREAQGEGIGGDVWDAFTRENISVFWRSRRDNAIDSWYIKQCDGLLRQTHWNVFWKGMDTTLIPRAVDYATSQPQDFERSS